MSRRNRLQFDKQGNTYFITTTVMNYDRIFELGCKYNMIIINSLKYLLYEHKAKLFAYVIMPSHLHIILYIPVKESIIDFMRDFKKFTSVEIRKLSEKENRQYLINRFKDNALLSKNQNYKIWMDRYDDFILSTDRQIKIKINYIHNNPVKATIVEKSEDFIYSSARNYILDDQSLIEVTTDWSID
jgi:putative transposase